jgi:hypothetical protein
MRTKALVCAALCAVGAISAVAQNVYSLNIVGYVNVNAPVGYSLLANPLSGGTTNGANEIITPPIADSQFLTWNGAGFDAVQYSSIFQGWINPATLAPAQPPQLPPGKAFFFYTPTATTLTFVGQVVPNPGATNNLPLPVGYSMVGSPMPVAATDITAAPAWLPVVADMQVLKYNGAGFTAAQYSSIFQGWIDPATLAPVAAPSYAVGEGFFFYTPTATTWSQWLP